MSQTRSLAVPPAQHGPLAQPAGAALVSSPPPPDSRAHARAKIVEARAWIAKQRLDGYPHAADRLERQVDALEAALGREPIEPVDARVRRLGGERP